MIFDPLLKAKVIRRLDMPCPKCGRIFKTRDGKQRHLTAYHGPAGKAKKAARAKEGGKR